MPKNIPQPVQPPGETRRRSNQNGDQGGQQEPLSGSKRVKQANHSRHNNGEG
jgi:small acid-soluble spore protein P (minor)